MYVCVYVSLSLYLSLSLSIYIHTHFVDQPVRCDARGRLTMPWRALHRDGWTAANLRENTGGATTPKSYDLTDIPVPLTNPARSFDLRAAWRDVLNAVSALA